MTCDTISQIAADFGYQSEAALSRAFRHRFGIRPGEFRETALRYVRRNLRGDLFELSVVQSFTTGNRFGNFSEGC
jgi:AraC-like DNA-binding protein